MKKFAAGSRPANTGNPDYFTGTVWQEVVVETPEPGRLRGLRVTFAPGARTAWHTHPRGQNLIVVSGKGRFQSAGEPGVELLPGDVIWIPPGEKHWHGAAPDTILVHLAFQEHENGTYAEWLEHVTDEDYTAAF